MKTLPRTRRGLLVGPIAGRSGSAHAEATLAPAGGPAHRGLRGENASGLAALPDLWPWLLEREHADAADESRLTGFLDRPGKLTAPRT